jgi:hypothetical protein
MLGLKPNGAYLLLLKHPKHQDGRIEIKANSEALKAMNLQMKARTTTTK